MAVNFEEVILFGKKSFSSLLKDVYDNQKKTESQIMDMIMALKPFITSPGEAVLIVPLIATYMEVKVKSDDSLVKLAAIVQRCIDVKNNGSSEYELDEKEKELLLEQLKKIEAPAVPKAVLPEAQKQLNEAK